MERWRAIRSDWVEWGSTGIDRDRQGATGKLWRGMQSAVVRCGSTCVKLRYLDELADHWNLPIHFRSWAFLFHLNRCCLCCYQSKQCFRTCDEMGVKNSLADNRKVLVDDAMCMADDQKVQIDLIKSVNRQSIPVISVHHQQIPL